jgi:hypothetical protein
MNDDRRGGRNAPPEPGLPSIPVGSSARRIPFDQSAIAAICETLQTEPHPAAYAFQGIPVLQAVVAGHDGRESVTIVFWPDLHRVDASSLQATVVMTGVAVVDLVEGVEVLFRGQSHYLVVALGGKIIVRM